MFCILVAVCSVYLIFILVTGFLTFYLFSHPKTNDFEKERSELSALGFDADVFLEDADKRDYSCKSFADGYEINYSIVRCLNSRKTVFIAHGYVGNRLSSLIYVKIFNALGYNCVVFDQRNHGANRKSFTSMGFYEKEDFLSVIYSALTVLGTQEELGIIGVSMGASTVLMAADKIENLDFAISDSAYTSLYNILKYKVARYNKLYCLGTFFVCNIFLKIFHGYTIKEVCPINCVKKIKESLPVLFIHSKADKMIPFYMFEQLYSAKNGKKSCLISETAQHAKVVFSDFKTYANAVSDFLKNSVHKRQK